MTEVDTATPEAAREVLDYWIGDADASASAAVARQSMWFGADDAVDAEIERRFAHTIARAGDGAAADWLDSPQGIAALIIVLDQFPRNLYRGTADAFRFDDQALALSLDLQHSAGIERLGWMTRVFALMPMQHAEDLDIQERSVATFDALAAECDTAHRELLEGNARYARLHRDIVARFGRFPHRNRILGRASTPEETAWLADGAPTFGQGG